MIFVALSLEVDCPCVEYIHNKTAREINFCLKCSRVAELCIWVFVFYEFNQHCSVIAFNWHGYLLCLVGRYINKGANLFFAGGVSRVDALEGCCGKSIQPPVPYQYDGHTIATNGVIGSAGVLVLLDVVFDETDAVAPEVLAGLVAVAAPGGGIHDDALRCRALSGREGFVADAFVGIDLEQELLGLILVLWLVAEMDAPVLIRPLVDFRRADQRQDGDKGKEESGHAAASMQGRACWLTQERHCSGRGGVPFLSQNTMQRILANSRHGRKPCFYRLPASTEGGGAFS